MRVAATFALLLESRHLGLLCRGEPHVLGLRFDVNPLSIRSPFSVSN
jgi:hypothetical protein